MSKFNLSPSWKLFNGVLCFFGLLLVSGSLSDYPDWDQVDIAGSLFGSFYAAYYFLSFFDQLVIDQDGFRYRSLGVIYSGRWSDVIKIANQRHFIPGLESIRQGAYIPKVKLTSGNNWLISKIFFVPLSMFVPNWEESMQKQMVNEYMLSTTGRMKE